MHNLACLILFLPLMAIACTTAPATSQALKPDPNLPDPFLFLDGSRVKTPADWTRRRAELLELFQQYEYGHLPPAPTNLHSIEVSSGTNKELGMIHKQYKATFGPGEKLSFFIDVYYPQRPPSPKIPVIIRGDACWGHVKDEVLRDIITRGYALIEFNRLELAPDNSNRDGLMYTAYPDGDFGALAAWAWGYHRCVDFVYTLDFLDHSKIAITGVSRGGKCVLFAGATDPRIALVNPTASGAGGGVSYRFQSQHFESLTDMMKRFPHWFSKAIAPFAGHEDKLPFDQHELKALVAPRALLNTEGLEDQYCNPQSNVRTHLAAKEVYRFLGAEEKIALHFRPGKHDQTPEDWGALLDFADQIFFDKKSTRDFNPNPFPDLNRGFTWTSPQPH